MTAEMTPEQNRDPYAPPPRHKEKSGPILRVIILGGLLAAAAWGYMEFGQGPSLVADAPTEQQIVADRAYDAPVQAVPAVEPDAETGAAPTTPPAPAG